MNTTTRRSAIQQGALDESGSASLQAAMDRNDFGATDLVDYYFRQIESLDKSGPAINSVLYTNPDAHAQAERLDEERRAGKVRGPLHGIPILLKANINTADRMPTTAGSFALHGFCAHEDAPLVTQLREAGVIILGKTNLSEWANFRSPHSSSGWSSEGGQTRNPYVLDRNPSGSSSGSGAAVAANLCAAAVGTETDGSIISPASINGIAGIKPTGGLVAAEGIIPISATQDTAGPMARTLEDAVLLLEAMSGQSFADALARHDPGERPLSGMRLGYAEKLSNFLPQVEQVMKSSISMLQSLGAEIIPTDIAPGEEVQAAEYQVLLYEFKDGLERYLARYVSERRTEAPAGGAGSADGHHPNGARWPLTLRALIEFNSANAARVMPHFNQEIIEEAAAKGSLSDPEYKKALETCRNFEREKGISAYTTKYKLDAILSASNSPAWKTDHALGDHYIGGNTSLAAISACPHITVPAGFAGELPLGLSIFGVPYSEKALIRVGLAFERATNARRPPKFLPSDY